MSDMSREFKAVDVNTGKVLWLNASDHRGQGLPLSFSVGGKQYIAVTTGQGGSSPRQLPIVVAPDIHPSTGGNALYVFASPAPGSCDA